MFCRRLAASFALAACAQATTIHVPADQPTIQAGLNAAAEGDTVLVAAGTYTGNGNKNISFGGVNRVLMAAEGPAATVIDCEGSGGDQVRGFSFVGGETEDSVVEGFGITGGWGTQYGGGVYCVNSSPTLKRCAIDGNMADFGGGLLCENASPTLTNCTVTNNTTDEADGGGVYCFSSSGPTLTNCTIEGNVAGASGTADGGGIMCWGSSPTLTNCSILNNSARQGGGIWCDDSAPALTNCTIADNTVGIDGGGGVYSDDSTPTLTDCRIEYNATTGDGGGLYCRGHSVELTGCEITNNTSGEEGAGIRISNSTGTLTNCTIASNSTNQAGGGLYCSGSTALSLMNCTLANNSASDGGGFSNSPSSTVVATNCILWFDTPNEIADGGSPEVTYCDVQGGYSGEGNIDADPRFVDSGAGDYHLKSDSPCIDTATATGAPDIDFEGDPRPLGAGWDIGVDEFNIVGLVGSEPPLSPLQTMLNAAYPNPFNPHTTIPFELAEAGKVRLEIFDLRGGFVTTLVDGVHAAGHQAAAWMGTDTSGRPVPSGVYLVRLETAGQTETRAVVLVK